MGYADRPAAGQTIDQMYSQLLNDKAGKSQTTYTIDEQARSQRFFTSRNYPIAEFERALKNLKDF